MVEFCIAKGRQVRFESTQQPVHRRGLRHFTEPHMHAGFQLLKMPLHAKARLFHEIGGQEAVDRRYDPRILLGIAITESQFCDPSVRVHTGTVAILTLRLRETSVYGESEGPGFGAGQPENGSRWG